MMVVAVSIDETSTVETFATEFCDNEPEDAIGPLEGHVAHSRLILAVRFGEPPACLAGVAFEHVSPSQARQLADLLRAIDAHRSTTTQDLP